MSVSSSVGDFDLNLVKLRKPLEFADGTIQDTAYTGDGSENLAEVLAVGNDALGQDILNVGNLGLDGYINQPFNNLNPTNQMDRTIITTPLGASNFTFGVIDTSSTNELLFLPCAINDIYNPVVEQNDIAIVGNAQGNNFSICPDSATNVGVRMTDNSITMGAGGAGNVPTNYFQCSGGNNFIVGNSTINGGTLTYAQTTNRMMTSAPSIDGVAVPAFEMLTYHLTGDAGTSSATMNLAYNVSATTNYAVFPSIYYGYGGSGGTYNAQATASALSQIVIDTITPTQFSWILNKSTGNNVNIYLVFLVVYNPVGSDYPKAY